MGDVVRMIDCAAGYSPDDAADLIRWARNWLDSLESGDYGQIKTLTLVVENMDGRVASVSQGFVQIDGVRLVGLLHHLAHRKLDGAGNIAEFRDE